MPFELRHRIASFHPDLAGSSPHGGPLALRMCTLKTGASTHDGLRWLSDRVHHTPSSTSVVEWHATSCFSLSRLADLSVLLLRCVRSSGELSRQAALLPLYQA